MPPWLESLLHIDKVLAEEIARLGPGIYALLWLVVFCETGLIIFPFLPGDSLLFASGMLSSPSFWEGKPEASGWHPNILVMCLVYISAAVIGDSTNFWIGRKLGIKLFKEHSKLFKPKHLEATYSFFDKHGKKTIIIGRFVPIVRTLVPFVAGLQKMTYREFVVLSLIGSILWVGICCGAGYLLGAFIPAHDFDKAILIVVGGTVLIGVIEGVRGRLHARKKAEQAPTAEIEAADPAAPQP